MREIKNLSGKSFLIKLVIALCAGVALGVVVGFALTLIPEEQLAVIIPVCIYILAAAFVVFCVYSISKYIKFNNELKRLIKILHEDIDVEKFIDETNATLTRTKNKIYRLHLRLNLAVGYSAMGDCQKALDEMHALDIHSANAALKALYFNNLTNFYLEAGRLRDAMHLYAYGEPFIDKLLKNPLHRGTFMHTKAAIEYFSGNLQSSEELLEQAKLQSSANYHLMTAVNLYLAKIYTKTGRSQKAKVLLEYNLAQRLLPNILAETKKLTDELAQY